MPSLYCLVLGTFLRLRFFSKILVAALLFLLAVRPATATVLDGGVDPYNLGKGDWIYIMSDATNQMGGHVSSVTDYTSMMAYLKNQGLNYIIIKAANGNTLYPNNSNPQFTSTVINAAHSAGLLIFGYNYSYGTNISGESSMADYVFTNGADGFVIDAEVEWESSTAVGSSSTVGTSGPTLATQLCSTIRTNWPNKFMGLSTWGYRAYHSTFPYKEFAYYCNSIMPQDYWLEFGDAVDTSVNTMNSQWKSWQNTLSGTWTNAIKPFAPTGQGWSGSGTITADQITQFFTSLKTNSSPVTSGGFKSANFWRAELHPTDVWDAIRTNSIGTLSTNAPAVTNVTAYTVADVTATLVWTTDLSSDSVVEYGLTTSYGTSTTNSSSLWYHTVTVSNLSPNTTYHYRVKSKSSANKTGTSADYVFTTLTASVADVYVDDTAATVTSGWTTSSSGSAYNGSYQFASSAASETRSATFRPTIDTAGNYDVYVTFIEGSNRATNSLWTVTYNGGSVSTTVNQTGTSGASSGWVQIATNKNFAAGTNGTIKLSNNTGATGVVVIADGVRMVYVPPAATAPSISTQPQSIAVNQGNTATFSVVASGTATLQYQWKYNGSSISGATDSSYSKLNAQTSDAGSYTVVITNSVGSVTSSVAVLTVYIPPSITSPPSDQTVNLGSSATFTVSATGSAPLSYQWQQNGTNISGATTSSYTRANAQATDAGSYSVIVTNAGGSVTSDAAVLTVNLQVSITTQPQSQTINQGNNATFTVSASGSSPITYQWRYNGTDISNATNSSYTRTGVLPVDAGSYSVVLTNAFGSATSSDAILTVRTPPSIATQPQSQTVNQNNNATFTVTANGSAPLAYQWRRNTVAISGATDSTYTRTNVVSGDAGSYTVVVTNAAGSVTSSAAILTVIVPPGIATQPASQTINQNNNVTFTVSATGTSPLSYQWRKNGSDISNATASSYTKTSVQSSDAASYSVVITNAAGSITSSDATLSVNLLPTVDSQPSSQTVVVGASATFSASASGTGPLSYQWKKNGTAISGATTNSYSLTNIQGTDAGSYVMVVTNVAGSASSSAAVLTVITGPTITTQPQSKTVKQGNAITFSVSATGSSPFAYQWRKNGSDIASATLSIYSIGNVQSINEGSYSVVVTNFAGATTSSDATLTVQVPPSISVQPSSQTLIAGNTLTLSVTASGTAPLSYQWKKNSISIAGATDSSYTKLNAQSTDSGAYTCLVTNVAGTLISATANITINTPPSISTQPQSKSLKSGSTATFTVVATGTAPLSYQWAFNTTPISGATLSTYSRANVQPADEGSYSVVITNVAGSITSGDAVLSVHVPPTIATQPQSITQNQGEDATFTVSANGTPPFTYQWRFKGLAIAGATDNTYTRPHVVATDAGLYAVLVTNSVGAILSTNAVLTVHTPPVVTTQPKSQTTKFGVTNVTFSVICTGTAPFNYQWSFNGGEISGATKSSYTLSGIQFTDAGSYSVVITNGAGSATSTAATLVVNPDINRPAITILSPLVTRTNGQNITVTGTAVDNVTVTQVLYRIGNDAFQPATTTRSDWRTWSADLVLNPGTNIFSVMAVDPSGNSITNKRSYFFIVTNLLTVSTNGSGTLSTNYDQQYLEIGRNYTIRAIPGPDQTLTNWTGAIGGDVETNFTELTNGVNLTFMMQTNLILQANFITNPFIAVKGAYNGLFSDPSGVSMGSAGFINLNLATNAAFSAVVKIDGKAYSTSGKFNMSGHAQKTILRTSTNYITLDLNLDWSSGSEQIVGSVSNVAWSSPLSLDRATFNALTNPATTWQGSYTMIIPQTNGPVSAPGGDGYALITNMPSGTIYLYSGAVGDASAVVQAVPISKYGRWPLFYSLYAGKGLLTGWLNFTNDSGTHGLSGSVTWIKLENDTNVFYPAGFTNNVDIVGSPYLAPGLGTNSLPATTNTYCILADGNLTTPLTNHITISNNVVKVVGLNTNAFSLAIGRANGLMSGSCKVNGVSKAYRGVVLQQQNFGSGNFQGTSQSGSVTLQGN